VPEGPVVGPPPPDVTSMDIDGRVVILNPATGRVASLNETATEIWQLATGEYGEGELVDLLAQRYQLTSDEIRAEVTATLDHLRAEGMLPDRPA
jgi:Coenzyme PQQ synthesis protein D (PqqD)